MATVAAFGFAIVLFAIVYGLATMLFRGTGNRTTA